MRRSAKNASVTPERAASLWDELPADKPGFELRAKCELVTPMYGGGVKAGEVDQRMPIRASAIRGQLRFWWRLLNAEEGKSSEQLFGEECELFGGISKDGPRASQVTVRIDAKSRVATVGKSEVPDYGLILEPGREPDLLRAGFKWNTVITATDEQQEPLVQALRWWASFGGVGARTRRGLGAIRVGPELPPVSASEVDAAGGCLILGNRMRADAAWQRSLGTLRDFRQGAGIGRSPGAHPKRPGRSLWPEADEIRRVTGRHAPSHPPEHPVKGQYPRAAFGLPIVFHFKDNRQGDPDDVVLEPDGERDRMASPLIVRPYFNGDDYQPSALLLPGWRKRTRVMVKLGKKGRPVSSWPDEDTRREFADRVPPMRDRADDPLTAFMAYFEQQVR